MPKASALLPVILCGGTGTRLWPLSRASYPKQYWALAHNAEDTLLQLTQRRLNGLPGLGSPCLLYTSPSPRDRQKSRMPSSA